MKITWLLLIMEDDERPNKDGPRKKQRRQHKTVQWTSVTGPRQLPLPFFETADR
jgi:hypothetical protein